MSQELKLELLPSEILGIIFSYFEGHFNRMILLNVCKSFNNVIKKIIKRELNLDLPKYLEINQDETRKQLHFNKDYNNFERNNFLTVNLYVFFERRNIGFKSYLDYKLRNPTMLINTIERGTYHDLHTLLEYNYNFGYHIRKLRENGTNVLKTIIQLGKLAMLKWFFHFGLENQLEQPFLQFVKNKKKRALKYAIMFNKNKIKGFLLENGYELTPHILKSAVKHQQMDLIDKLHQLKCPIDEEVVVISIKNGLFSLISKLFEIPIDSSVMIAAIESKSLQLVKDFHTKDPLLSSDSLIFDSAIKTENYEIMEYLYENKFFISKQTLLNLIEPQKFEILEWFHSKDYKFDIEFIVKSIELKHYDFAKKLYAWKCPLSVLAFNCALKHSNTEFVEWLESVNCPCDVTTLIIAIKSNNVPIIKELHNKDIRCVNNNDSLLIIEAVEEIYHKNYDWYNDRRHAKKEVYNMMKLLANLGYINLNALVQRYVYDFCCDWYDGEYYDPLKHAKELTDLGMDMLIEKYISLLNGEDDGYGSYENDRDNEENSDDLI